MLLRHCPIATMQSVVTKQAALSLEWNVASKGEHKKTGGGVHTHCSTLILIEGQGVGRDGVGDGPEDSRRAYQNCEKAYYRAER